MKKVCAVIVTYNRKNYLKRCLEGLKNQSYKLSKIFVFDNHSTDDTVNFLKKEGFKSYKNEKSDERIYFENSSNEGGAGGFAKAIKIAQTFTEDYLWIMDDDVYPNEFCLKTMLNEMKKRNIEVAIPNRNSDGFYDRVTTNLDMSDYKKWWFPMRKEEVKHPLKENFYFVKDISFEGLLISMNICKKAGIPDSEYFLEFDDTDYAFKIQNFSKIIYVTKAKLLRQITDKRNSKNTEYNWKNYYMIRNTILFEKKYGENWRVRNLSPILLVLHHIVISKRHNKLKKNFPIIIKAYIDGIKEKAGKVIDPNY